MTRVTLLHVAITGSLLGVVTHLFVQSTSIDPEDHVRVLEAIDALNQSETDLRRNLLLVRGDLLLHYDTVNSALVDLHQQVDNLRLIAMANASVKSDELSARFAALAINVAQDEELVEQFKWNNALLRNSWTYFAQKSRSASEFGLTETSASGELSRTVVQLLPAMMLVQHQPHSEAAAAAATGLARLEALSLPRTHRSHVASMVMHGRLILRLSPDLDSTLKTLLTSKTPFFINELRTTYLNNHQRLVYRAELHRVLLYAASLLLLVYLAYLYIRLQAGARALTQSNAGLLKEISERKQAEGKARALQSELTHAHRLSLLGEMASGLAHELNQPLTAIRLYAKGCVRRLKSGEGTTEEILDAMNQLSAQVLRAGDILGWIRGFVKKRQPQTTAVDVNALIREAVDLLGYERKAQEISVQLDLTEPLPCVEADKIEIQQIILNLARNSMEAMSEDNRQQARLAISTARGAAGTLDIAVTDNGHGMSPAILAQAFDSFFTTKPQGMGLGLAISRSMIEAHGGQLWATSQEGVGTTVRFSLRIAKEDLHGGIEVNGHRAARGSIRVAGEDLRLEREGHPVEHDGLRH
ncbi:MAG: DAHL domain-containing protein [Kiloniellaceae bacterium]